MLRRVNKQTKQWHGIGNLSVAVFASLLILTAFILVVKNEGNNSASPVPQELQWNSFQSSVQFHPSLEVMNGTDVIWQIPDSSKAVLFLAHGCYGKAANFWDTSTSCPNCVGLPEERLIVLHALARKFSVLTISSIGKCWSLGKDKDRVKGIIRWFIEEYKLEKLPIVALGASSGGYFVSALANEMNFRSITLMIAEGEFESMDIRPDYPPTLFVHMPKDHRRMRLIAEYMEYLKKKGVPVAEVRCTEFPLSPKFLSDRIPGLDPAVSFKLFEMLHEKGFIDQKGYMKNDGRAIPWKASIVGTNLLSGKKELVDHIQEEMNLAFAYHEMTSLQSEQIFKWFESYMS
ncbi:hypothetical protein ACLOJK_010733 [Asimina triloba]